MAETNKAVFSGRVLSTPRYLTESHDNKIYEFEMESTRNSGIEDRVTVNCPSYLTEGIEKGDFIKVVGEFRSYNKRISEEKSKLILTLFAQDICDENLVYENEITLDGYICKPTKFRTTPFGREIADALIAVNRGNGRSDYIPCIFWGHQAKFLHNKCQVGDGVKLSGRIQSREYQKYLEDGSAVTHTAYEVSVRAFEKKTEEQREESSSL